jgi:hypothetical protein
MTMQWQSNGEPRFRQGLRTEFDHFISQQAQRFDPENCLRIDFHCHDYNSDVPDGNSNVHNIDKCSVPDYEYDNA